MNQIATTIRMDKDLKLEFDNLCYELGMSLNTAVNIFIKAAVRTRSIPFKIELDSASPGQKYQQALNELRQEASKLPDMSMDEINEMIDQYRSSK